MNTLITPTTELEAVNAMLEAIGESPVSTLSNAGLQDAAVAYQTLKNTLRRVQTLGWSWNTDLSWTFYPDDDGFIQLPANTLKADTVGASESIDAVIRGQRLYDRVNHTYVFSGPVTVELVSALSFEELPESARQYVMISAGRTFVEGVVGSDTLSAFTRRAEQLAWAALMSEEGENGDYNYLTGSAVARVLIR